MEIASKMGAGLSGPKIDRKACVAGQSKHMGEW